MISLDDFKDYGDRIVFPLFKTDINIESGISINIQLKYSSSQNSKIELYLMIEYADGEERPFFEEITILEVWTEVSCMISLPEAKRVKIIGLSVFGQRHQSCGFFTVGRLRASLSSESTTILDENILISATEKVFDETKNRYEFSISWIPRNVRFYEIFVNEVWIGTSFVEKYRISIPPEDLCKYCNVRILAYGNNGDVLADLNGMVEF